jgi:glutamate formiminotransferase/formiminotetrahydrofolate cyclodeaminase
VAALAGALGSALAAMDANLTVGKKGYEGFYEELSALGLKAQKLKKALLELVDEDTAAFNAVMDAMRLPKSTEAEKRARDVAIETANKEAASVPLKTSRFCLEAMRLCLEAARTGNSNSATDAATGCLMAWAGLSGAVLNVRINIKTLSDEQFTCEARKECDYLETEAAQLRMELEKSILGILGLR